MNKEEKNKVIEVLAEQINSSKHFYMTDIAGLNAEQTSNLRRKCHENNIKLMMVKNTLFKIALEKSEKECKELYETLKGNTAVMFSEVGNVPAKLIKDLRKELEKPILKGAFVEEGIYLGDNQLDVLAALKSKEELIGDIILLLQSPMKNVVSSLKSGSSIIAGVVKTLQERNV